MWYKPTHEASINTPAVLVFPDRIKENIRRMISMAGGPERLRPHVKTHKMAEVIRLQVKQGIRKFKCATLSELAMVAENGGEDVLLAYPLLGPAIGSFLNLMEQFPGVKLAVTVDSMAASQSLSEKARQKGLVVRVLVDLDNGMHRTGIAPEKAGELIRFIQSRSSLNLGGFHIYDGHIREGNFNQRKAHCDKDFEPVLRLKERMEKEGIVVDELACGGTPTFPIHLKHASRSLCPGTPILWDAGYGDSMPDLDFLPAAVVAARVISNPGESVCLDLGHKAIASEMPHPRIKFLDMEPPVFVNHSEEHLVVSSADFSSLQPGDLVYGLPIHICPTIALHEQVYVVEEQIVKEVWNVIARKRNYLIDQGF